MRGLRLPPTGCRCLADEVYSTVGSAGDDAKFPSAFTPDAGLHRFSYCSAEGGLPTSRLGSPVRWLGATEDAPQSTAADAACG